jgi:solute carrier family 25 S-adenosylmethionine transporter 26
MFSENSASFVSGAFAGLVTDLSLHPLDTIKTRLQTKTATTIHTSSVSSFSIKNLFRGLTPALCGSCPSGAAFFGTYQFCSRKLEIEHNYNNNKTNKMEILGKSFLASSIAESSACIVRAPVEIVKNNMQVGRSFSDAISHLSAKKFGSVYVALIYRELPFALIQLPTLEILRQNPLVRCIALHLSAEYTNVIADKRVGATVVAGFFAGGLAGFLTTPFDIYKSRISTTTHVNSNNAQQKQHQHQPFYKFVQRAIREEGIRKGLFVGAKWRVGMISCGGAIFFGSQEWMKRKLLQ